MSKLFIQDYTGYVYIWFDKKRKMFYLGSHEGPVSDSYTGSGKRFSPAFKKRPEDFKMRIVEFHKGDRQTLYEREQYWLDMIPRDQFGKKYYNLKPTAEGGNNIGRVVSDETRAKVSKVHKGKIVSEETRAKMRLAAKNRPKRKHSEETKKKIREGNLGVKRSAATRKKNSEAMKGRVPWNKGLKYTINK